MRQLIFATHNKNKLDEVRAMFAPLGIDVIGGDEAGLPDVEETGATFEENAMLKAKAAHDYTGQMVFAEDAGISIAALGGAPGIYSARFAKKHGGFPAVFDVVQTQMGDSLDRSAFYTSCMIIITESGDSHVFNGYLHGNIIKNPVGENGFGFDPIFIPNGMDKTVAQLSKAEKNTISHRASALQQVVNFLKSI